VHSEATLSQVLWKLSVMCMNPSLHAPFKHLDNDVFRFRSWPRRHVYMLRFIHRVGIQKRIICCCILQIIHNEKRYKRRRETLHGGRSSSRGPVTTLTPVLNRKFSCGNNMVFNFFWPPSHREWCNRSCPVLSDEETLNQSPQSSTDTLPHNSECYLCGNKISWICGQNCPPFWPQ
jgi:hypothetical protein